MCVVFGYGYEFGKGTGVTSAKKLKSFVASSTGVENPGGMKWCKK